MESSLLNPFLLENNATSSFVLPTAKDVKPVRKYNRENDSFILCQKRYLSIRFHFVGKFTNDRWQQKRTSSSCFRSTLLVYKSVVNFTFLFWASNFEVTFTLTFYTICLGITCISWKDISEMVKRLYILCI